MLRILCELFYLLICKQALIVSRETCCRGSDFLVPRNKRSFILLLAAAPPREFLEWHHTVSAFVHLPVITLASDLCCLWSSQHFHDEARFACMRMKREQRSVGLCNIWGRFCLSLLYCFFNTSAPHSELACKALHVCLEVLLERVASAEQAHFICRSFPAFILTRTE